METITASFIESNNTIISSSDNMLTPCKCVRNGRVHNTGLGLGVNVHGDDGAVEEASSNTGAIGARADRDAEVLLREARLALVGLEEASLDLAVGEADDKFSMAFMRPSHACDGGALSELVADGFLVTPLGAESIDEDDVV